MGGFFPGVTGLLGQLFGGVSLFQSLGRLDFLGGSGDFQGFRLFFPAGGVGHGHFHFGGVFALDGLGISLSHLDALVSVGVGFANRAVSVFFSHALFGVVDGLGGGFFAQGVNVAALVRDVGDVHVDEPQADFLQLALHIAGNGLQKFIPVGVDFLNVHGGDDQTQLAENNVFGQLLDFLELQAQQALGGVLHNARLCGDAHSEAGGHVDADILAGQGVFQIH